MESIPEDTIEEVLPFPPQVTLTPLEDHERLVEVLRDPITHQLTVVDRIRQLPQHPKWFCIVACIITFITLSILAIAYLLGAPL